MVSKNEFPKEFGGIVSGFRNGNIWIIVDFEIPNNYKNSKTNFTRDVIKINSYLKKNYKNSGGLIEYLGEWHTHPLGDAYYSQNDLVSMREIAIDKKVIIETPLLFIFSLQTDFTNLIAYQFHKDELIILEKKDYL